MSELAAPIIELSCTKLSHFIFMERHIVQTQHVRLNVCLVQ